MQYFTVDRWLRLQSSADRAGVLHAMEEWEQALSSYREAMQGWLQNAPRELRQFASSVCLHDATLQLCWQDRKEWFFLLQLDAPEQGQILLSYTLVSPPWVSASGMPEPFRTPRARWMYDEIEAEPSEVTSGTRRKQRVYQHRILFSHGWEVCLRFTRFRYSFPQANSLLPVPTLGSMSSILPAPSPA